MPVQFPADGFHLYTGNPHDHSITDRTGAAQERRSPLHRLSPNVSQYRHRESLQRGPNQQHGGNAVEPARPMLRCEQTVFGIQEQGIEEEKFLGTPFLVARRVCFDAIDGVPALEAMELPAFTTGHPPGGEPVDEGEVRIGSEMEVLALNVARSRKELNGVRREDQERTGPEAGLGLMAARSQFWVAINLGRSLRADKATGVGFNA